MDSRFHPSSLVCRLRNLTPDSCTSASIRVGGSTASAAGPAPGMDSRFHPSSLVCRLRNLTPDSCTSASIRVGGSTASAAGPAPASAGMWPLEVRPWPSQGPRLDSPPVRCLDEGVVEVSVPRDDGRPRRHVDRLEIAPVLGALGGRRDEDARVVVCPVRSLSIRPHRRARYSRRASSPACRSRPANTPSSV